MGLEIFDEAAAEHKPSPPCSSRGETPFTYGKTAAGYQRFRCPNCKQLLRLKRGCGEKQITCAKCGHQFQQKA